MTYFGFNERLQFSRGVRERCDIETIKSVLHGCVDCVKTDEKTDRKGIDYIATLRKGTRVSIDAKARDKGCSKWWRRREPDLALEIWSVKPSDSCRDGKAGWTLSERSDVDMILFTFDEFDTEICFLIGFQNLRMAFRDNHNEWCERYDVRSQETRENGRRWESECVFVPETVVMDGIVNTVWGKRSEVESLRRDGDLRQGDLFAGQRR